MGDRVGCLILLDTPLPKRYWSEFSLHFGKPRSAAAPVWTVFERITTDSVTQSINYYTPEIETAVAGVA